MTTAEIVLRQPDHPWVGRGGLKLAHALDVFRLDVRGADALDIGASTGGFTDVLLDRGAARVVALDVGHNQLDWRLRNDPRVVCLEGVNARHLQDDHLPAGLRAVHSRDDRRLVHLAEADPARRAAETHTARDRSSRWSSRSSRRAEAKSARAASCAIRPCTRA